VEKVIRRGALLDLGRLVPLVAACFEAPWSAAAIESALAGREARGWVAEATTVGAGDVLLGFVLARRIVDVVEIDLVGVAPTERRCGLAARMLGALIDDERGQGAALARLELSAANTAAAELYAGMGFVVVGRRPRYYPDGSDALLLSRASR
jgi:ribosomal protein S18 acetylase RimI-like enzyme